MKTWEVVTHEEPGLSRAHGPFQARLIVRAGAPTPKDGLVSFAPGVAYRAPCIVIGQTSGDRKTGQGSQLQGIAAKDARALAALLIEAADHLDSLPQTEDLQESKE